MAVQLSERIQRVKPSATLAISTKAQQLKQSGKDIINLSVGEPDFDTPDLAKQAAITAMEKGLTKYTPVAGTLELRNAILTKMQRDHSLSFSADQVVVTCGAKQALFNAMQALLNDGDEVLIPAPYWVSYADMALVAGAVPIIINTKLETGFKMSVGQLEQAITPKTRMLLLNSPSNPTGVAYRAEELRAFADILVKYPNIVILCDDIYEKIYWGEEPFKTLLNVAPELAERTIIINGASKAYSMTGWRIGYAVGPKIIIKAMTDLQSHSTSNACSIAQAAAACVIAGDQSIVDEMLKAFKKRHDYAYSALKELNGIECLPADGAFYLFPRVEQAMARLGFNDDLAFAEHLLMKAEVAVVPGSAFGAPGYMRLSTALSMEHLQKAIGRIQEVIHG